MPQSPPEPDQQTSPPSDHPAPNGFWNRLDAWMAENPWHPRIAPYALYLIFLLIIELGRDHVALWTYPLLYTIQCAAVAYLLYRYRALLPELTLRFHWLAVPIGLGLTAAWVALGWLTIALVPGIDAPAADADPHYFQQMLELSPILFGLSIGLRLLGMAMLVPLFEELFIRSLCLRSFHDPRKTFLGIIQFLEDVPLIGDWIVTTRFSRQAAGQPPMFSHQFNILPLGTITAFGFAASTLIFMLAHMPRDWLGCIACSLAWCWLLWFTNRNGRRMGLGPIVWSHGITNAALWAYVLGSDQWLFM